MAPTAKTSSSFPGAPPVRCAAER